MVKDKSSRRGKEQRGRNRQPCRWERGRFYGGMSGEINKRGEKSLSVLRALSLRQLKEPSKSCSNQQLNKDKTRRRFGWPRCCNLTPTALNSEAPWTQCVSMWVHVWECTFLCIYVSFLHSHIQSAQTCFWQLCGLLKGRLTCISFLSTSFSVSLSCLTSF